MFCWQTKYRVRCHEVTEGLVLQKYYMPYFQPLSSSLPLLCFSPIFCCAKHRGEVLILSITGAKWCISLFPLPCPVALRGVALAIYRRCHEVTEELRRYYIIFDWGVRSIKRAIPINYRQSLKIYWLNIRFFLSGQTKKQIAIFSQPALCGPTWAWTKDPLIMSQML